MDTFTEWANPKIKLGFYEKYNMFITRLSSLQSLKMSADSQATSTCGCSGMVGYAGVYGDKKTPEEMIEEADLMWNELKDEIKSSLSAKKKKDE